MWQSRMDLTFWNALKITYDYARMRLRNMHSALQKANKRPPGAKRKPAKGAIFNMLTTKDGPPYPLNQALHFPRTGNENT